MNEHRLKSIKIWQQNTRKSRDAQLTTIHGLENKYDIICLQEPNFDFQETTRATRVWHVVTPSKHRREVMEGATEEERESRRPRAIILIHERIATSSWTQVEVDSLDIVAIRLRGETGVINIYNVYNDCTHSRNIETWRRHLEERETELGWEATADRIEGDIWLGDFNRHHPMWDDESNNRLFTRRALDEAELLIDLLAQYNMDMCLPKGIPTIRNSRAGHTRPDNVFCTDTISEWITRCNTSPGDRPPTADHFPIATEIDLPVRKAREEPRSDYWATDWKEFRKELEGFLGKMEEPRRLESKQEMNEALERLEKAVMDTIEKVVPKKKPSPYARRWWTRELKDARISMRNAGEKAYTYREHPYHSAHKEYRTLRNQYTNLVKKTKQDHWESWLENIMASSMWNAHKFMTQAPSDRGKTRIPALKVEDENGTQVTIQDNDEKSKLFHKAFFFDPPADMGIDPNHVYPEPAFEFEEISDEQVKRTAETLSPYKAPGLSGIANAVLTHCADLLAPYLGPIYRATFDLEHYPEQWKRYNTVVSSGKSLWPSTELR